MESLDGSAIDIEATPRNPADTLPPASVAATIPAPSDCTVEFDHDEYPPPPDPPLALNPSDKLLFGITLGMDVNGAHCGVLTVRFSAGVTGTPQIRPVIQFGCTVGPCTSTRGTVTIPKGEGNPSEPSWLPGRHLVEVFNNCPDPACTDTPLDTTELVVP